MWTVLTFGKGIAIRLITWDAAVDAAVDAAADTNCYIFIVVLNILK